jgi:hypothetical protein
MKSISKEQIDRAFENSLARLSILNHISLSEMTIAIRFFEKGKSLVQLCSRGRVEKEVSFQELFNNQLLSLRFSVAKIERLFKVVHTAFMFQTHLKDPVQISLLYYFSQKWSCPCLGIMQDEKPIKVLMLSRIIEAIELESEQSN